MVDVSLDKLMLSGDSLHFSFLKVAVSQKLHGLNETKTLIYFNTFFSAFSGLKPVLND